MRKPFAAALALAAVLATAGCTTANGPAATVRLNPRGGPLRAPGALASVEHRLVEEYNAAIYDAAVFRADHQVAELEVITGPTIVATWQTCDCPTCSPCLAGAQTLTEPLWVTVSPAVRDACRGVPRSQLVLRLQQLLGLPPVPTPLAETYFLEFAVKPADVFRPCTDPDPTASGPCTETFPEDVPAAYRVWMAEQMLASWQIPEGYPWTRLGYTYNWSPSASSPVGPSEFVVKEGARVEVTIVPTAVYCDAGGGER